MSPYRNNSPPQNDELEFKPITKHSIHPPIALPIIGFWLCCLFGAIHLDTYLALGYAIISVIFIPFVFFLFYPDILVKK